MVDSLDYFSFKLVLLFMLLQMMNIKDPLILIKKKCSSCSGGSVFPLSICLMPLKYK